MTNISFNILLLTVFLTVSGCISNGDNNKPLLNIEMSKVGELETQNKSEHQLAKEVIGGLLNNGIDTILNYKRTCINCCDFYNIFWIEKGQPFLHKLYYSFEDNRTHSLRIKLNSISIFEEFNTNYFSLRNTSIKKNEYKTVSGTSSIIVDSHYCFSSIRIYTGRDSIFSSYMKDIDFNKNSGSTDEYGYPLPNLNYTENINSKWFSLLSKIENEILSSSQTSAREKRMMREK